MSRMVFDNNFCMSLLSLCRFSNFFMAKWQFDNICIIRSFSYRFRDHPATILNVTDACLSHPSCLPSYPLPIRFLLIAYASWTNIVSYLTLYILCIYPVILKNATHRAAFFLFWKSLFKELKQSYIGYALFILPWSYVISNDDDLLETIVYPFERV